MRGCLEGFKKAPASESEDENTGGEAQLMVKMSRFQDAGVTLIATTLA